jgi:hypothetical protein
MLQVYTVHVVFLHEQLQIYLRYGAWSDYLIASSLIQTMRGVLMVVSSGFGTCQLNDFPCGSLNGQDLTN